MSHFVRVINGKEPSGGVGGVSDADLSRLAVDFFTSGVVGTNDYKVEQQATPNMTVKVNTGNAYVPKPDGTINYSTNLDAAANVTIGSNASGSPRIDAIVIKVDTVTTPNNLGNNVTTLVAVQGSPAGSPTAPSDSDIQTSVGAGNAFLRLANVTVANGASSITTANISDARVQAASKLVSNGVPSTDAKFKAYRTTDQSIANNSPTKVQFNAEDFDPGGDYDAVTNNRYTAPEDGYYLVSTRLLWQTNGTGERRAMIYKNGSEIHRSSTAGNGSFGITSTLTTLVSLTAGDYIEVYAFQNSGGSIAVENGGLSSSNRTEFAAHLLSS